MSNNFFSVLSIEKFKAIQELVEEAKPSSAYYFLLFLSTVIASCGVLLANPSILIGGMLVAPLMSPILLLALAVSVSRHDLFRISATLIAKSVIIIFTISFISGIFFGTPENGEFYESTLFDDSLRAAFLYFIVAFTSGLAAAFAWARKEIQSILPGIAVAVALVPPLAMVGIWLATGQIELMRFFSLVFLFNLFGIVMGAMVIFSMFKFNKTSEQLPVQEPKTKIDETILQR